MRQMRDLRLIAAIASTLLLLLWAAAPVFGHTQPMAKITPAQNNVWELLWVTCSKTVIAAVDTDEYPLSVYNIIEPGYTDAEFDPEGDTPSIAETSDSVVPTSWTNNDDPINTIDGLISAVEISRPACVEVTWYGFDSDSGTSGSQQPSYGNLDPIAPITAQDPSVVGSASTTLPTGVCQEASTGLVDGLASVANTESAKSSQKQVEDIIQFFDASVDGGTLYGKAPGKSAKGQRGALRQMLELAGNLIAKGHINAGCRKLQGVYERCDGLPKPADFVTGGARSQLALMIEGLLNSLGYALP